jgi:hypothetical protein
MGKTTNVPKKKPAAAKAPPKKTLEQLAAEQGIKPVERFEDLLGKGDELWATDEEFEAFLKWLKHSRRVGG